jgi:preprotein translocase subunit SecF
MVKLYILIISLFLFSCGSRKAIVNKAEIKTETSKETTTTLTDSSNVTIKYDVTTDLLTVFAKDTLKPFTYNGNTYFNAVLRHEKKKDNSLYSKQNNVKYKQSIKYITKTVTVTKTKEVIKKESYFKYLLLLLVIIVCYLIYRFRKVFAPAFRFF